MTFRTVVRCFIGRRFFIVLKGISGFYCRLALPGLSYPIRQPSGYSPMRTIAVFGGSDWKRSNSLWELGVHAGRMIAVSGSAVMTGGYGGAMEAVSEGASGAEGVVIGVLFRGAEGRSPNPYLTERVMAEDYQDRMARLLRAPEAIALPGGSGTLAEIFASAALLLREPGRRLAIWAPFWRTKLEVLLSEMAGGGLSGVEWIEDEVRMKRWITPGSPSTGELE
jgi:uncharacterized protein (TIGR00725 family)